MDFDEMMDVWEAQDENPLYGINRDLLGLVLRHEQAAIRRELRWEQWVTWGAGLGMIVFAGFWLWMLVAVRGPALQIALAVSGIAIVALWTGGFALSRHRQAQRERSFGNTVQEEVGRSLSLIEYQLSRWGRWSAAMLWTAPLMLGSGLIYALIIEINYDPGDSRWEHVWMLAILVWGAVFLPQSSSREVREKLEPRRRRLRELLEMLNRS